MYLKKLELAGFKSFADRTEIVFEKGITCVVGPNGCGKSNIVDAIQWVLGSRSPKTLRGSTMQDVIFSGTDFRTPTGFCEVSLSLDNSDGALPIPYAEVEIGRRLYRSGESQYLINKTPCRARDIQDLILDTGIGRNAYSVIGQGRVGDILAAEGDERRALIEEAAGISKYKVKKEEALRKLEHTEQNLLRLRDIVSEVERNIRYAERQAKRAEEYRGLQDELKRLATVKAFAEWDALATRTAALAQERSCLEGEESAMRRDLSANEDAIREREAELARLVEAQREADRALVGSEAEVRTLDLRLELYDREMGEKQKGRQALLAETFGTTRDATQLAADAAALDRQVATEHSDLARLASSRAALVSEREARRIDSAVLQLEAKALRERCFEEAAHASALRNQLEAVRVSESRSQVHRERIERDLARLADRLGHLERSEAGAPLADGKLESLQAVVREREQSAGALQREGDLLAEEARTLAKALAEAERALFVARARHADVVAEEKAVREFVSERSAAGRLADGLVQPLREIFEARPDYERALEAALEDRVSMWLVEHIGSATRLLAEVSASDSIGRIRLLVREHSNGAAHSDLHDALIEGSLLDFVKVKEGFEDVARTLLGPFHVARPLTGENASRLFELAERAVLVTREGTRIGAGPVLVGGRFANGKLSAVTCLTAKSLDALACDVKGLNERLREREAAIEAWRASEESARSQAQAAHVELAHLSGVRQASQELASDLAAFCRNLAEERDLLAQELALAGHELEELAATRSRAEEEWRGASGEEDASRHALEALEARLAACREEEARASEACVKSDADTKVLTERLAASERELARARECLTLQREHAGGHESLSVLEERLEELAAQSRAARESRERAVADVARLAQQAEHIASSREALTQTLAGERETLAFQRGRLERVREAANSLKVAATQRDYEEQALLDRMEQTFGVRLRDLDRAAFTLPADLTIQDLDARLEALRQQMGEFGAVNLLAVDEYKELSERFSFLSREKEDLERARLELLEAIRKINRTTRELFDTTLAQVREKFGEMFRILFSGGQADLFLMDETHPLESGLDIVARPPGKKLQRISLLSGGERALAAIALLFALFAIKPSPFCVLDEVDAPLDEANVDRFGALVRRFLAASQFIVITHNRKTIAGGDALYGITMPEPGVSQVVSVRMASSGSIESHDRQAAGAIDRVLI